MISCRHWQTKKPKTQRHFSLLELSWGNPLWGLCNFSVPFYFSPLVHLSSSSINLGMCCVNVSWLGQWGLVPYVIQVFVSSKENIGIGGRHFPYMWKTILYFLKLDTSGIYYWNCSKRLSINKNEWLNLQSVNLSWILKGRCMHFWKHKD